MHLPCVVTPSGGKTRPEKSMSAASVMFTRTTSPVTFWNSCSNSLAFDTTTVSEKHRKKQIKRTRKIFHFIPSISSSLKKTKTDSKRIEKKKKQGEKGLMEKEITSCDAYCASSFLMLLFVEMDLLSLVMVVIHHKNHLVFVLLVESQLFHFHVQELALVQKYL